MNAQTTITTAIVTPGGIKPTPYQAVSLKDAVRYEPDGVYTVTRTYRRIYGLKLSDHLDRLEESAHIVGIPVELDRVGVRAALRQLIDRSGYAESRFRITIPAQQPDHVYLALEPLQPVSETVRTDGVRVKTFHARRENPAAKDTRWMDERAQFQAQLTDGLYEGLLIDEQGALLEGLSSNFYAILNGELHTAGRNILNGISRRIVLTVTPGILPLIEEAVTLAEIPQVSEAFMTSSSRGVIPVVEIDGMPVNGGKPGPLTRTIALQYDQWSDSHLEAI